MHHACDGAAAADDDDDDGDGCGDTNMKGELVRWDAVGEGKTIA